MQATVLSIQLDTDPMTRQLARDVIALEINAEHAMAINFTLQMQAIQRARASYQDRSCWAVGVRSARWERRCVADDCHRKDLDGVVRHYSAAQTPLSRLALAASHAADPRPSILLDSCGCSVRRSHSPVGAEGHRPAPQCPGKHRSG